MNYIEVRQDDIIRVLSESSSSEIVIDFDHTICAPNASEQDVKAALRAWRPTLKALIKKNRVECISNGTVPDAARSAFQELGIEITDKAHKPFSRRYERRVDYVIGDLFITDGLLARRFGATFLYFHEPKRFPRDHWTAVLSAAGLFVRVFMFHRRSMPIQ